MGAVQTSKTSFYTEKVVASLTRPADTTQYAAGDVIAADATDNHFVLEDFTREGKNSGMITTAKLFSSANQGTKLDAELWLFYADITEVGDNVAFAPADAELLTLIGVIDFPVANWKVANAGSGAAGNCVCQSSSVNLDYVANSTAYGVLVARNTYTPVNGEIFTLHLGQAQD